MRLDFRIFVPLLIVSQSTYAELDCRAAARDAVHRSSATSTREASILYAVNAYRYLYAQLLYLEGFYKRLAAKINEAEPRQLHIVHDQHGTYFKNGTLIEGEKFTIRIDPHATLIHPRRNFIASSVRAFLSLPNSSVSLSHSSPQLQNSYWKKSSRHRHPACRIADVHPITERCRHF